MSDVNWRDVFFKAFWTLASGALSALAVYLTPLPDVWALILLPVVNAALAWVRQQTGATPPDAPPVGAFATNKDVT